MVKLPQLETIYDASATVIDAKGKHLTSGIIDEHSHIAISSGLMKVDTTQCRGNNTRCCKF
jgi:imidazolonepropionase-like amidohydrolase